jgi:Tol biopolymer transport system component
VDWSPIGDTLVYENYNTGAQDGLYLINVNGTGRRFFASTPDFSSGPVWSFDGHEAVFFGDHNIYVIHADGTQQQVRSSNDGYDPAWSP